SGFIGRCARRRVALRDVEAAHRRSAPRPRRTNLARSHARRRARAAAQNADSGRPEPHRASRHRLRVCRSGCGSVEPRAETVAADGPGERACCPGKAARDCARTRHSATALAVGVSFACEFDGGPRLFNSTQPFSAHRPSRLFAPELSVRLVIRRPRTRFEWIAFAIIATLAVMISISVWWVGRYAIKVHALTRGVGDTVFYAADGRPWFRLDEQRHDVTLDRIAPDLQRAVVAIEDRRFFYHPGLDPIGIGRAVMRDMRAGSRVEGGSTITQQLARTLFLSNARTYGRKMKEAVIALLIEVQLSKPQIL